jgi:putative addiction module component (TIGR02574 family)
MELLTNDELVRLTPSERLSLISQLGDSLEDEHLPLTAAQRAELDRRLASLDQDRREGITWRKCVDRIPISPTRHFALSQMRGWGR